MWMLRTWAVLVGVVFMVSEVATAAEPTSAPAVIAQPASHELTAPDVSAWLSGVLDYGLKNGDIAGAVVSVVKDGRVLFQSGYGYADVEKKIPMEPELVMTRIGSTSKLFTWTAVMQLVQQGKLDLNRNVDDYLDFKVSPVGGPAITLLDLMNHRGGFEEGLKDLLSMDPQSFQSNEAYLKGHPRPLLFAPGSVPAYSNYGTALAGYIVQRVSGESFEHYIGEHIFQPLGMHHSTFVQPLPEQFKSMMSQGYRTSIGDPQPYELVTTQPAGAVATTAADMALFMIAHLQDGGGEVGVLDSQTARLMHTPSETALPGFDTMAHGFFYEVRNGRPVIGHGGDTVFFHSDLQLLPQESVGIFVSFNSRGRDDAVYGLRKLLVDQFVDRYFPPKSQPAVAPALASAAVDAQKIAGRYQTSRRVEHGFLKSFYLLQQAVIRANPDGTINAPGAFGSGETHLHEVAPDIWQELGGSRKLAIVSTQGSRTVIDSDDPSSVLQEVPTYLSAPITFTILIGSILLLFLTCALWPALFLVRRYYQRLPDFPARTRCLRIVLRLSAVFDLLWLGCWTLILLPALSSQLEFYSTAHDALIFAIQLAGVVVVALGTVGVWGAWQLFRSKPSGLGGIGNGLIAAGLVGVTWIGFVAGFISFSSNY